MHLTALLISAPLASFPTYYIIFAPLASFSIHHIRCSSETDTNVRVVTWQPRSRSLGRLAAGPWLPRPPLARLAGTSGTRARPRRPGPGDDGGPGEPTAGGGRDGGYGGDAAGAGDADAGAPVP
eukprot:3930778-Rhodomonas_salina.1